MLFLNILTLIVAKAIPYLNRRITNIGFTRISAIVLFYSGVLSFNSLYIQSIGSGVGIYSGFFHITQISQSIECFLLVLGSFILIAWPLKPLNINANTNNIESESIETSPRSESGAEAKDYSLIILFSTLGSCLLISSSDLVSLYLSIELQSFGLYVLSTLYRDSESSTSAGLKYFLLGGLSSCIILLGAGLIYAFSGLTNFESIYSLISVSENNYILQGISLGIILIIIGFLFKIAAAPLHNWAPDVYDDTPTIVTIWLTIMPKISILILLLELHTQIGFIGGLNSLIVSNTGYAEYLNTIINSISSITAAGETEGSYLSSIVLPFNQIGVGSSIYLLKNLLLISSLLSLILGTVVGLAQTRIKRLLAYSTISHIGFILLALAINTEQSIDSLLFYIIQYSITNLNVFLIIIALSYVINNSLNNDQDISSSTQFTEQGNYKSANIKDIRYISELKSQFFSNPLLSLSLAICLFSMAGIPPLMGFFSKQFVLYSAVQSGYNFIAIVAIIVSVISASYYLRIIKVLHTEPETELSISKVKAINNTKISKDKNEVLELDLLSQSKSGYLTEVVYSNLENNISAEGEKTKNSYANWYYGYMESENNGVLTNFHSFLISSLTLSILLFILKPSLILNSTQLLSLSLFNY